MHAPPTSAVRSPHVCTVPQAFHNASGRGLRKPRCNRQGHANNRSCLLRLTVFADLRQALVTKQKFSTFTNKEGRVLTQHTENVWGAERPFTWLGIDVNGRGAVVKLSDGSLWVHSPVKLDPELKTAMDALGPVKHIVTPNFEHNKHAQQWIDAYPDAKSYVCPGGMKKFPDITYTQELGRDDKAPPEWLGEIEPTFLSYEAVPILKFPFFNEVVFVHKPSGTLIAADLIWDYPRSGTPKATQAWKFGMDQVYRPFYNNLMIKDKGAFKEATKRLLDELDWDSILPCHGNFISAGGKQALLKHLGLNLASNKYR
ncbi:hypothetical protein ABBQ32_006203 [Trebouxia sp. C0010 RCD-2024]